MSKTQELISQRDKEFADMIIEAIEKGAKVYEKEWHKTTIPFPHNPSTGTFYKGINGAQLAFKNYFFTHYPDEKVESEAQLKENMRALFEEPDNQVAKVFWQAYFVGTFGEMEYKIDFDKLDLDKLSSKKNVDKEIVTIGSRTFVLVKEKSQWKVDIVNSKLELEQ